MNYTEDDDPGPAPARPPRERHAHLTPPRSAGLDLDQVRLMEQTEAQYFRRFLDQAPARTRLALGISTTELGGGVATAMTADSSGFWTKAIGLGFDSPVNDALVEEAIGFFAGSGKEDGTIAIAPPVQPNDWAQICRNHGLIASGSYAKLACPVDAFARQGSTDLQIRPLVATDAGAWNLVVQEAFGMTDPDMTPLLEATINDPLAHVLGAWDGGLLVAAGAVHLLEGVASLNTGATLRSHRGRGAQSTLIAARAAAAAESGCLLLTAETGSTEGNASYRNLRRSGFTHHYNRTHWHWEARRHAI